MDNNESFEKWYKNSTNLLAHGAPVYHSLKDAWQAAQQQSAGEIAELKADNERLREALQLLRDNQNGCPLPKYEYDWNEAMRLSDEALSATTSQSLQAHDNEVLERAALVAEKQFDKNSPNWIVGHAFAEAIRALKGK